VQQRVQNWGCPAQYIQSHTTLWALKKEPTYFVCNFVENQLIFVPFSLIDLEINGTCDSITYPPHLTNVATVPCESQNTKNVILQWDITKENCIRCIIASSKWTRVIMCFTFTYLGCYAAKRV